MHLFLVRPFFDEQQTSRRNDVFVDPPLGTSLGYLTRSKPAFAHLDQLASLIRLHFGSNNDTNHALASAEVCLRQCAELVRLCRCSYEALRFLTERLAQHLCHIGEITMRLQRTVVFSQDTKMRRKERINEKTRR